jgi:PAS domain S-box-containing protein
MRNLVQPVRAPRLPLSSGLIQLDRETHVRWVRIGIALVCVAYVAGGIAHGVVYGVLDGVLSPAILGGTAAACVVGVWLARHGRAMGASVLVLAAVWLQLHASVLLRGGETASLAVFPLLVMTVGLLCGGRCALAAAVLSTLTMSGAVVASAALGAPASPAETETFRVAVTAVSMFGAAALVRVASLISRESPGPGPRSEQRLTDLTSHGTDGMLAADGNGQVLAVNPPAEQLLGSGEASLRGESIARLLRAAADGAEERRKIEPLLAGSGGPPVRLRIRSRGGRVAWVDASITPVSWTDGSSGRQVTLREVTRQRQSEEVQRLLQTHLESSLRLNAVGRLARGVAHDLNNLLTVIGGAAELLLMEDAEGSRVPARDILAAKTRGAALAERLLSFSREDPAQPRPLRLDQVIREVEPLLNRFLTEGVRLELELDPLTPPVMADRSHLEQVVVNLVINAKDAIAGRGRVRIMVAPPGTSRTWRATSWSVPPDMVELAVEDDGEGMPPETLSRVFEPFFTTKPRGPGRGLGLATVHGIVGQSGGRVRLLSEPDIGTAVILEWPVARDA